MRALIYGGCCVQNEFQREQVILWARLARHLNPDTEILLLDAASAFDPGQFLPKELRIGLFRFSENVGHLSKGGGDGAGRTLVTGIETADASNCDYAVHWGTDMLIAKPLKDVLYPMQRSFVAVAALPLNQYQFPEWEFSVWSVQWARATNFVEKYGWNKIRGPYPTVPRPSLLKSYLPEWRLKALAGPDLFLLPLWGIRNDQNQVNVFNLHEHCPYEPPAWLHMFSDLRLAHRFLELNEISLP